MQSSLFQKNELILHCLSPKRYKCFRDGKSYQLFSSVLSLIWDWEKGEFSISNFIVGLNQQCYEESPLSEHSVQVHEREHDREISELITKHKEEMEELRAELNKEKLQLLDELQQQMAATHKAEIEHAQLQSQVI